MRISYWSSDVCSSDRNEYRGLAASQPTGDFLVQRRHACARVNQEQRHISRRHRRFRLHTHPSRQALWILILIACCIDDAKIKAKQMRRSEEHTSELQSLMRISYAVFCLQKKKPQKIEKEIKST